MKTTNTLIALTAALALHTTAALAVVFTSNTTIGVADATYDGQDIVVLGCTLTVNGPHTFQSLILQQGAPTASVLTHSPAPSGEANNRLDLTITGDVTIQTGARIDVSGRGYVGTNMPGGAPRSYDDGGGGGHGGDGGFAYYGPAVEPGGVGGHGSVTQPADFGGSGGGTTQEGSPDSPGGGAVKLSIGGTLTVEGSLLANGTSAWINDQGGAAGGSIWIIANRIAGSGTISASGGVGEAGAHGGGGGGGRIALYYGTNDFAGTLTAQGGLGKQRGGAGTIYFKANSASIGTVVVNNAGGVGASTPLVSPVAFSLTISNAGQAYHTAPLTLSSLRVATNGVLYHFPTQSLSLTVQGDATIDLGGTLNGNGRGYPIGTNGGPGLGFHANTGDGTAGGGGYGGMGGYGYEGALAAGGASYGSILQPTDLGSAGGYGDGGPEVVPGGGAIRLTVGGVLTVNGQLSVNGDSAFKNDQGGGAGGSLWLAVGGLAGTGSITANGGVGEGAAHGGGGAGGRIAIYYASNSFAGALTAYGGPGTQRGGAGTIYTKAGTESVGHLALHNGDVSGALTPLTSPENFHALIQRGAIAQPVAPLTLATLTLATNGQVYGAEAASPLAIHVLGNALVTTNASLGANSTVTVDGDLTVDPGGAIHADAKGYASAGSPGPGTGANVGAGSTGGGHGGPGAICWLGGPLSSTYDSMLEPADFGSRGGDDNYGRGGNGGGRLRLQVGGTLTLNGRVSAKGENAPVNNAGGGAGGSIWINAQVLTGNGVLAANGGNGEDGDGGGGGGGRIAVYYDTSTFSGTVTAYGGGGYQRGGAGTIYLRSSALPAGYLIVNQGGNTGVPTPLDTPTNFNLIIGNQGLVHSTSPLTLSSLRLQSGGTLTHPTAEGSVDLTISGDVTIETNGLLTANGRGYPVGDDQGPGAGLTGGSSGGGGAYGGNGGVGYAGDAGGVGGYGSIVEPVDYGSAGGGNRGSGPGGAGGGAIKLVIGGTLTVDGALSANGNLASYNNAGGGAGGSIWASANALAGTGTISAIGGSGEDGDGGGGSGGRIALYFAQDNFAGATLAYGGGGRQYGGAGTIFRKASAETYGTALFDNQGRAGAMSPLRTPQLFNLTVAGNTILIPELGESVTVNRLEVSGAGRLTHLNGEKLRVNVLQDAWVQTNGLIQVNGLGYPVAGNDGPGHGNYDSDTGSGAGHGGVGGNNWAGLSGGITYDAAGAPVEWGSAGGPGDNNGIWCPGGGAIQLNVIGALTVDGTIAANGSSAFSNDQGGGAGGSIWLNVGSLAGTGLITANGGNGESSDGGGGGGGRIAIYHNGLAGFDTNHLQVAGGSGRQAGGVGTIYLGDSVANVTPVLLALTPAGTVAHWVDTVEATFNTAINASTFTADDVVITTPAGVLPAGQITVTELTPQVFRIRFPAQMADGLYAVQIGPAIANTFATPMAAAQMGEFAISIPRTLTTTAGVNTLSVTWPTIVGLWYRMQASPDLANWTDVGGWSIGNGAPLRMTFSTTNAPQQFFRLMVQ